MTADPSQPVAVKIKLFGEFRLRAGAAELDLRLGPSPTVREAMSELRRRFPTVAPLLPGDEGPLSEYAVVAVNGLVAGADTRLTGGDLVMVLPPFTGG